MKLTPVLLAAAAALASPALATEPEAATVPSAWDPSDAERICATPRRLGRVLNYLLATDPALNYTNTGMVVKVYSEARDEFVPLYEHQSRRLYTPASNVKLFTMGAAYLGLADGAENNFVTAVEASGGNATLCLRASGDAGLSSDGLAQLAADAAAALPPNATVAELVVDSTRWDPAVGGWAPFDGSWEWGDLRASYAAQPTPAVLNGNYAFVRVTPGAAEGDPVTVEPVAPATDGTLRVVVECRTGPATLDPLQHERFSYGYRYGSATVPANALVVGGTLPAGSGAFNLRVAVGDPAASLASAAADALSEAGVAPAAVRVGRCPEGGATVAQRPSAPLAEQFDLTLKWSNNLYTEEWLRALGDASNRPANVYADAAGKSEVRRILAEHGVDTNLFVQRDGSGLSRYNLAAPEGVAQVLEALAGSEEFVSFLPVAGQSGTLAGRFVGTPAEGVVHAKTGSLTGVNALSGYVLRDDFPPVIFSILQNGSPLGGSVVRPALDNLVVQLAKLRRCRRHGRYVQFDDGVTDETAPDAEVDEVNLDDLPPQ